MAAAVPGAEIAVPHTETSAPDNETLVPDIQAVVPGTQAAVPDIETTILGIDAGVPDDRAVVSDNQATVPSNQAADPGIKAGVPDTDEARAISDDTPLAEAVNALFASTPERGEDGVPVGDRLAPLLPQHPNTPLDSPVVVRRYSVPQGPGKERDVPVMVTQYALPTDEKNQGDHNVLLTQISFPDGVPGVERQGEEEEKDAYSTGTSVELINTTEEYDTALETKHTEHTQSKGILVERKDEGDTTTTTPPELQGTPGDATDFPQGMEHLWDLVEVRELTRAQEVEKGADKRKEPWDVPGRVWQGTKPRTPSALEMMVKKATTEDGQSEYTPSLSPSLSLHHDFPSVNPFESV
ncbi:hypothetical protein E2C01_082399 [Portunus trituberculatus]|uniref:Uncharacterized protein n=1 Tax=Portunus trituberculatus TaxID=210409 RepID=A0A5B7J4U7_PORTR|nr:hypothetical protein [Portunus trituberculatus]